jgi:hypothetical protein
MEPPRVLWPDRSRGLLPPITINGRSYDTTRSPQPQIVIFPSFKDRRRPGRAYTSPALPFCGGPLHCAHYPRKPRGGPPDLEEAFEVRFSLCCGRPGCRRRVLPPSVRFWGRRVYWAPVLLLVSALRQGRNPTVTLEHLKALFRVWRSTIKRWQRYFRDIFAQSIEYRRLAGHLMPPIAPNQLPKALLERFYLSCAEPETALVTCLQTLALGP